MSKVDQPRQLTVAQVEEVLLTAALVVREQGLAIVCGHYEAYEGGKLVGVCPVRARFHCEPFAPPAIDVNDTGSFMLGFDGDRPRTSWMTARDEGLYKAGQRLRSLLKPKDARRPPLAAPT